MENLGNRNERLAKCALGCALVPVIWLFMRGFTNNPIGAWEDRSFLVLCFDVLVFLVILFFSLVPAIVALRRARLSHNDRRTRKFAYIGITISSFYILE